jgi:glycosyltransferase involved in cell wall biosynthesis
VVTSAIGGALEIVDASCGVLVPPSNPSALATALQQLLADAPLRHGSRPLDRHARER